MKLELGGGTKSRGDGWVNIDRIPTADIIHDLNVIPWPLEAASIEAVYSSHCLEHLNDPVPILFELYRVCAIGAPIEIHVPHPISDLAMICDHKHVFSPIAAINMERFFPREFWRDAKRLKLENITYGSSCLLEEAKAELPFLHGLSDITIMKWIPRTCHECVFYYRVVPNEFV